MPGAYLVTVELEHVSGLPKDTQSMSFAVQSVGSDAATLDGVVAGVNALLTTDGPGGLDFAAYISPVLSRNANDVAVKLYDIDGHLDGSPHGSPVALGSLTLPPGSGSAGMPSEICSKVTLRAHSWDEQPVERADGLDPGPEIDRPRQRYTGGFYTPSLCTDANDPTLAQTSRPKQDFRTTVMQAVDAMYIAMLAGPGEPLLSVWSRADANVRGAELVQIDNSWDVQRRKGEPPTVRQSVTLG